MSEGFADMSASLYLTMIEKNPKKFLTFWNDEGTFYWSGIRRVFGPSM